MQLNELESLCDGVDEDAEAKTMRNDFERVNYAMNFGLSMGNFRELLMLA